MANEKERLWTRNFTLFSLSNFFRAMGVQFLNPTLPLFAVHAMHVNQSQVGYLLGVYSLSALLIRPYSGYAFDFLGRKKTYAAALACFTVISLLYPFATSLLVLIFIRFLHGLCFGITSTGSGAIIGDVLPETRRGEGIGYYGLANTISRALGPAVAVVIMGNDKFFQLFFAAAVLSGTAFLLARAMVLPPQPRPQRKVTWRSLFEKRVVWVSAIEMLAGVVNGAVMSYIILFARDIGIINGGIYFFVNSIGVALARLFAGKIVDRSGPRYVISFGFIMYALGLIALSVSSGLGLFLAAALAIGLGNGIIMPTLQTMVINIVEAEYRGVASSTFYALTDIGVGGGSIVLGLLTEIISLREMFMISGLYLLIPLILFNVFAIKDYRNKLSMIKLHDKS